MIVELFRREFKEDHQEHSGKQKECRDLKEQNYWISRHCPIVAALVPRDCLSDTFNTVAHKMPSTATLICRTTRIVSHLTY
jgi:hypothetical protein